MIALYRNFILGIVASYGVLSGLSANPLLDQSASYESRMHLVQEISLPYSVKERFNMVEVLKVLPKDHVFAEMDLASLKNNIADNLLAEKPIHVDTIEVLLAGLQNDDYGIIWQDYILQKAYFVCASLDSVVDRRKWVEALLSYTNSRKGSLAGTALLALYRISLLEGDYFQTDEVGQLAHMILDSKEMPVSSKLTALAIGSRVMPETTYVYARELLAEKNGPVMLKVASIHALSGSSAEGDIQLIKTSLLARDIRLRRAAEAALSQL